MQILMETDMDIKWIGGIILKFSLDKTETRQQPLLLIGGHLTMNIWSTLVMDRLPSSSTDHTGSPLQSTSYLSITY